MKRKKTKQPEIPTFSFAADGTLLTSMEELRDLSCNIIEYFVYLIKTKEIETCDTARLIDNLRPNPDNPMFTAGPGKVIFLIEGYGDDPRELALVPEFQAFVRKAEQASPCWLYFALPESTWLRFIMATANQQCMVRDAVNPGFRIGVDINDLHRFLARQIREYHRYCRRGGISGNAAADHLDSTIGHSFPNCPPLGLTS